MLDRKKCFKLNSKTGEVINEFLLTDFNNDRLKLSEDKEHLVGEWSGKWDLTKGLPSHDHQGYQTLTVGKSLVASMGADGEIILRKWKTGEVITRGVINKKSKDPQLILSPDEKQLVLVDTKKLEILDLEKGQWKQSKAIKLTSACFTSKGQLVTGHTDGTLKVWNSSVEAVEKTYSISKKSLRKLEISTTGTILAISADNTSYLIDTEGNVTLAIDRGKGTSNQSAIAFTTDSPRSLVHVGNKKTQFVEFKDGKAKDPCILLTFPSTTIAGTDNLFALAAQSFIYLFDPATGKKLGILEGHLDTIRKLAFSPDGKYLFSAASRLLIWDVASIKKFGWSHPKDEELVPLP